MRRWRSSQRHNTCSRRKCCDRGLIRLTMTSITTGSLSSLNCPRCTVDYRQRVIRAALAVGGVFLVSAYAVAMFAPATGTFHDDGIYIVTARALAEGEGYRIISLPESPPQTKYPTLFPWLLSLVWRLAPSFPDNLPLLRTVPVASTVAWLWLSWRLTSHLRGISRRGHGRRCAHCGIALGRLSGTALLSETLFAALLTGSLLLLAKVREESAPVLAGFVRSPDCWLEPAFSHAQQGLR